MDRDGVHVLLCICVVALMLMTIPLYIDGPRKFGSSVTNCVLAVSYTHLTLPTKRIV